jgi:hypothetical protein
MNFFACLQIRESVTPELLSTSASPEKWETPSPQSGMAGMDNRLFVSKYQLELPDAEVLQRYLDEQRRALEGGGA